MINLDGFVYRKKSFLSRESDTKYLTEYLFRL